MATFTRSLGEKDSRPDSASFVGIAIGLSQPTVFVLTQRLDAMKFDVEFNGKTYQVERRVDGSFVWPKGLPKHVHSTSLTVVDNVLTHGTGAINIDGCRVGVDESELVQDDGQRVTTTAHDGYLRPGASMFNTGKAAKRAGPSNASGRFPANILHDGSEEVVAAFPGEGDKSASRFFYSAKASKHDRAGSKHPTVKPVALMQWLIRLVCPKGGTIIDPFSGSGTTGAAAYLEGVNAILCEREEEYLSDIRSRLNALDATDKKSEPDLFD